MGADEGGLIQYLFADKRFFEPLHRGQINAGDYEDFVLSALDAGWAVARKGAWTHCMCSGQDVPLQGWKIHLSATPADSEGLLRAVTGVLVRERISFKFMSDKRILRLANSKSWPRGGSGKFITVYPGSVEDFKRIIDKLYEATRRFAGPYVLSDRRYKDSKVLYYRYGGMRLNARLGVDGRSTPVLVSPDGAETPDLRAPYFALPPWERDLFPEDGPAEAGGLARGRFIVEQAIHFSNTGGVYVARDQSSGKRVLLKEARSHVHHASDSVDAAWMVRHEYSILQKLAESGLAPKPVALFEAWEHVFLAEEYLEGHVSLKDYAARDSFLLESRPTAKKVAACYDRLLGILGRLAAALEALHRKGIVFGDLSPSNVLLHEESLELKLIDFESAREVDGDDCPGLFTRGFADPRQAAGAPPDYASDRYAFGRIAFYLLTHMNQALEINPEAEGVFLAEVIKDFGLPPEVREVVSDLSRPEALRRSDPATLMGRAASDWRGRLGGVTLAAEQPTAEASAQIAALARECQRFVKGTADFGRTDRLFPADSEVFETNPLSLAHGAMGVIFALNKVEGTADPRMIRWVDERKPTSREYPPGLYLGRAGIAWAMLEIGEVDRAKAIMAGSFGHPLLPSSATLYHGAAGWGMANLRFWLATGDGAYVDRALAAAEMILSSADRNGNGLCWPDADGQVRIGLAHGSSGVGLFLLYLTAATGRTALKEAAVRALDHDIAAAVKLDNGGLTWPRSTQAGNILYPYWEYGSAGIGIACLRFHKHLGDPRYADLVERIYIDCDRKYAIYPGRNIGLAGIAEFLCDAFQFTKDQRFLNSAYRLADGIKLFAIRSSSGAAFPGTGLERISCDLATGASGIMLSLDRIASRRSGDFMLDALL